MSEAGTTGTITLEREDDVLTVRIANPGRRNALTWAMYSELEAALDKTVADPSLKAVVLRGSPSDGFAAGTDISQFVHFVSGDDGVDYEAMVARVVSKLLAVPVPVIALVEGAAVGAGLVLAACSDVIVAEKDARFGVPITRTLGNCIPAAVIARLRDRVGSAYTSAMLLTATLFTAEQLASTGFVVRLVEKGGLDAGAADLLGRVRSGAPLTVRALKQLTARIDSGVALPDDHDLLELCYGSEDFREGLTAFLDGRRPVWKGR